MKLIHAINQFFQYVIQQREQIFSLLLQHIYLSLIAVAIAVVIGVPLGILVTRIKKLQKPIIGLANVMQAIPSIALLGFLIPVAGIGSRPAIIMVVLYSLLPIIKNTHTGLSGISPDMLEAALGIGLTRNQILTKVQLPLALPIIMAGIRISAVTAVGLMTISAFVGAGGLGYLVFSGVQTVDNYMILAGAIPACILALFIDFLVGRMEKKLSYQTRIQNSGKSARFSKQQNRKFKVIALCLAGVLCITAVGFGIYHNSQKKNTIVIGSKNFTEQLIVGNMLADVIEAKTDLKVERKLNLGGTQVAFSALNSGNIDAYVSYTGTGLINILNEDLNGKSSDDVYREVQKQYNDKYHIKWLKPLGFNNTYVLAVKQETADQYNLKTISDLAAVSDQLVFGPTIEFPNRSDGLIGLKQTYTNLNFKKVSPIDGSMRYTALETGDSDVIDAFSTDGLLAKYKLVTLKDDRNFFPPYYAAPVIREDTLKAHPELEDVINTLASTLDDDTMRSLNYKVDDLKQSPDKVAKAFLEENHLLD